MNNIWTVIFKPDTLKYWFDEIFIKELEKMRIKTKFRKIMKLNSNHMEFIYPDKIWTRKEKFALYSISHWQSMILILEWNDIYENIKNFKWNWNKWWIRQKYLYPWRDFLEKQWFFEEELEMKLSENRLHSTDNYYETIKLLSWILNFKELEILKDINILLYNDVFYLKIQKYLLTYKND